MKRKTKQIIGYGLLVVAVIFFGFLAFISYYHTSFGDLSDVPLIFLGKKSTGKVIEVKKDEFSIITTGRKQVTFIINASTKFTFEKDKLKPNLYVVVTYKETPPDKTAKLVRMLEKIPSPAPTPSPTLSPQISPSISPEIQSSPSLSPTPHPSPSEVPSPEM